MKKLIGGFVILVALTEAFFGGVIVTWYMSLKAISENAAKRRRRTDYSYYRKAN